MEGCRVMVFQHFNETISIGFGPQQIGKYSANGQPLKPAARKTGRLELTVRALFVRDQQTGHLMC